MKELISIIIPIYNISLFLKETINSICSQTYTNLEIILVNDGSTDCSPKICNDYALLDKRIKVVHKKNGGLSSARNVGIDNATGNYIFFLDGDDFVEKDTIELLCKEFAENSDIGIVSAPCFYSYKDGQKTIYKEDWNIKEKRTIQPENFCINTLTQKSCHSACCKLYKNKLFEKVRFREGKRNEDTLFMFDLSFIMEEKSLKMVEIPNKLYYYRVNNGSITHNVHTPIEVDIIENLQDMMQETSNLKILKILKQRYYTNLINFYSYLLINKVAKNSILPTLYKKTYTKFNEINFIDLFNHTSFKIVFKYILIKYLYISLYKFKN